MSFSENLSGPALEERLLYLDNAVVVVQKLPGEVCSFVNGNSAEKAPYLPEVFSELPALQETSRTKGGKIFLECVHRIDRPVSGCAVMARTKEALAKVSGQFTNHKVAHKKYWAIVEGIIPVSSEKTLLEDYLIFNTKKQKTFIVDENTRKAKKAQLYWKCAAAGERYSFIEIELLTGRTHQIRAQLANAGMHIKGDVKYGARRSDTLDGIRLHAREVSFISPDGNKPVTVISPLPVMDPLWEACLNGIAPGESK